MNMNIDKQMKFLWCLPFTILMWVFYILPIWIVSRDVKLLTWAKTRDGYKVPILVMTTNYSWYARKWRDWLGWAGPFIIIVRHLPGGSTDEAARTIKHELEHVDQQARWGILFFPAYIIESVWIWFFEPKKHPYFDNHFEKDARQVAGQMVDIPRSYWTSNNNDRWPWW
jgi:hypothetical protein